MFFNRLIINVNICSIIYITREYVMNQTNTHNNTIIYADSKMPGRLSLVEKYTGHVRTPCTDMPRTMGHVRTRITILLHFAKYISISGGNYTLVTFILYTTRVTHSECEISQSWRT